MAPLAVDPEALDGAGVAVISVGGGLGSTVSTLTKSLAGCHGMSGDDPAGAAFGHSYDRSASKVLEAMATTRNGLCRLGDGVRISAHNYSLAEANSNIAGRSQPLPGAQPTGAISAGSAPSSVGHGVGAPAGWGWVSKYIGMIWPTGDSAKLRGAAAAWTLAGTNFEVGEITGALGPMGSIAAQQIPEGPAIAAAFTETNRCAGAILQQCTTIATQLSSYATKIDTVHAAIVDLLSRICNPTTGFKIVWEFLTDEDEDEIKKIANDIRTIVHQFTAEVDALRQQIATALTEATTILSTMARYAHKEWDHFLHTTDVGRALNQVGQYGKGFAESVGGLIKDSWTYGPVRAQFDPKGSYQSWNELLHGMAPLVGLGDEHAPSVAQSWKDVGKNAVHWDEWKTNPAEAAGKSTFDLATLLIPGAGEAAAAAKGARATAGAAEAASVTSRAESAATRTLEGTPKPHAPAPAPHPETPTPRPAGDRPPPPDKPAATAPGKPDSAPTESPTHHGPTEPKPAAASTEPSASVQPKAPAEQHPLDGSTAPGDSSALAHTQASELASTHPVEGPQRAAGMPAEEGSALRSPSADPQLPDSRPLMTPDGGGASPAEPPAHAVAEPGLAEPSAASAPAESIHAPEVADRAHPEDAANEEPGAATRTGPHQPIANDGHPGEGGSPNGEHPGAQHAEGGSPNAAEHHGSEHHEGHLSGEEPDDQPPPSLHRKEPLPTEEMGDSYRGENDPADPNRWCRRFNDAVVKYLSAGELESSRLYVEDGRLHNALDGTLFDTRSGGTVWNSGRAIYIMDEHGNLYASLDQEVGKFHHSSFLGGKPVAGAGEIEVRDGVLTLINRSSGHYQPTEDKLLQVREMLRQQGIDINGIIFGGF